MIQLKDINKTYNNGAPLHVLKGINLDIQKGEFVSIMGSSGSGKSTLLNILGILDSYDTGEYYLNGTLIKNLSETKAAEYRNRMIGFIFQSFNLISFKNAVENVALPLFYQGVSRRKRNALALEYLERGGSSDVFNLGNGAGYSVREIIETARRITGKEIKAVVEPRRGGDPSVLIASNKKAAEILGWKPVLGLDQIISAAWAWHSGHPNGYEG